jgi:Putative Ig domain
VVRWNGAPRTTTGSATQLTATINAVDIASQGTASVTVLNPSGAESNALTFMITQAPPAPAPLTITTSSLPNPRVGLPYSAPLAATGGTGSYTWSLVSGTLPDGLSLNPGEIRGMPTSANSTTAPIRFTVKVTDTVGGQATKALTIKVNKQR